MNWPRVGQSLAGIRPALYCACLLPESSQRLVAELPLAHDLAGNICAPVSSGWRYRVVRLMMRLCSDLFEPPVPDPMQPLFWLQANGLEGPWWIFWI